MTDADPFGAIREFDHGGETYRMADLTVLEDEGLCDLSSLPVSIRILLESVLRNVDGESITAEDVRNAATWEPDVPDVEVPFTPSRVVLQDLTGVPAVVDLAA
ncbi:MAG: aconitate hydratase, partial [Halobacteriales archaeon]|nr:aconitate hydratase [Halobacteriales archaeon]